MIPVLQKETVESQSLLRNEGETRNKRRGTSWNVTGSKAFEQVNNKERSKQVKLNSYGAGRKLDAVQQLIDERSDCRGLEQKLRQKEMRITET